jgi:hypothetical protein
MSLEVKYRQLGRQVGMLIENPPMNLIASFNSTSIVLDEGTTLTFTLGFWICIANDRDDFGGHRADTREREASTRASCHDINNLIDNLGEIRLSDLISKVRENCSASARNFNLRADQHDFCCMRTNHQ